MHTDCLTYDYSICDIVFHLPFYMVNNEMLCNQVSVYTIVAYVGFALFLKLSMIITDYNCIKQKISFCNVQFRKL